MTDKVHLIVDYKPHKASEVICINCLKRWIAVRPETTLLKHLECEKCGQGFVIETGEIIYPSDESTDCIKYT